MTMETENNIESVAVDVTETEQGNCTYTETSPVVDDIPENLKGRFSGILSPINTFNYPSGVVYKGMQANVEKAKLTEEEFNNVIYHHAPMMMTESCLENGDWRQYIEHSGERIGLSRARFGNTAGALKGAAAVEAVRRRGGNGTTVREFLPRSNIWVTMRPATEDELIELDHTLSTDENIVGRSSAGMMLDAGSGTFAEALVNMALSLVIDTNVTNRPNGIAKALYDRIDVMDYTILIGTMLRAQYPDGYPWEFTCCNSKCNHVERGKRVNFSRMSWIDYSALISTQLDSSIKHRNAVSDTELETYRKSFSLTDRDHVYLPNADLVIHFRTCSLGDYLTYSKKWIKGIEDRYTKSLTSYHTAQQRSNFISSHSQAHRFAKYMHLIDKISFKDCDDVIDDIESLEQCIDAIDTTTGDFNIFEEAAITFIEASTISIFGYPVRPCEACGHEVNTKEGRLRSIVPVSPDRTFFTLAQLKTLMMVSLGTE